MSGALYVALLHHPIRSKQGTVMTTAVTNLDVHDLARAARTYGASGYFLVTPIQLQRRLVEEIVHHWREGGPGERRIPQRSQALRLAEPAATLDEAIARVIRREGRRPHLLATAARSIHRSTVSFSDARNQLRTRSSPTLLLFGTGHGLTDDLLGNVDEVLAPIRPGGAFNHLSVRTAAAVVLDRLIGDDERLRAPVSEGGGTLTRS